jgi:YfiH family protein
MQSKPELEVIVPEWNAPENIKAFFTLRSGGMSACAYGDKDGFCGLNLGNHVGDNKYSVRGNRRIVTDMLGAEPKWLSQVHSSRVVRAEEQADAEFTTAAGIPCVVMTADCVPVLLCDKKGIVIAAAHAGWKGLADGVLQNTVAAMRKEIGDEAEIIAWIGPHIQRSFRSAGRRRRLLPSICC